MSENLGFFNGNTLENGEKEYSREIPHSDADVLVTRAENSGKPIVLQIPPEVAQEDSQRILGFNFDSSDVLEVLKNGATGIYLAVGEHKAGEFGSTRDGYTLILYGTKEGVILNENKAFNYSKPCPCNCPRTGQTC